MIVSEASDPHAWDSFLLSQPWKPFLQSWTMGEVYRDIGQEPIRLEVRDGGTLVAICQCILVPAKRGRHLSIPYGPVTSFKFPFGSAQGEQALSFKLTSDALTAELRNVARERRCAFIRISPFWPESQTLTLTLTHTVPSPLHLLAEHVWYLPLANPDPWQLTANRLPLTARTEAELLSAMRKTTRNLIRRAERDGVTVEASGDPNRDLSIFLKLHNETRLRHGFTPYTEEFFTSQLKRFSPRSEATLYLARFQGSVIAASIHMHMGGETSYHHGASSDRSAKVPASYLLQWTAIRDALRRGDHVYNFWGIAPMSDKRLATSDKQETLHPLKAHPSAPLRASSSKLKAHPFSGVTLFKTGFGGELLNLQHCMDIPLSPTYWLTYVFETVRRWRRGF